MSLPALVAWTAVVLALSTLALPLAAALFPTHLDRGASLAPVLAVGTLTLVGYWVGHVTFGPAAPLAGVVVLGAASGVAWRHGHRLGRRDLDRLRLPGAVFAVAFLGMLWVRYVDPAAIPAGGEKFLDLGLLAVLDRTAVLPPEDVWFAGKTVRYYYGGPLAVTLLSDLAGVPPRYAYNLGLATFYAMLATAVSGLAAAIADAHGDPDPRIAGVLAAFLVAVGGRLATPVRLLAGTLPVEFARDHLAWVVAGIRMPTDDALAAVGDLPAWSYWLGRYVVPDALHVFPSWAWLNGDLHAHLLATPFLVLAAATALAAARTDAPARRLPLLVGVLPATAGLLALTSTWSAPTAVGLAGLAFALAPTHPLAHARDALAGDHPALARLCSRLTATRPRAEVSRLVAAAVVSVVVAGLAVAWAYPFLRYQRPASQGIGFFPPGATLGPLLLAHGLFLAVFAWGFLARRPDWPTRSRRWLGAWGVLAVALAALVAGALAFDVQALLLFVPVIALGWVARRRGASDAATLAVAGAGILLVAELAYAKVWPHDPNAPRWNTIYKISMQAFVLWGTAAGVLLARELAGLRAAVGAHVPGHDAASTPVRRDTARTPVRRDTVRTPVRRDAVRAAFALLVLAAAATFPAMALAEHAGGVAPNTEHTLDATEYVATYHPGEVEALRWLRDDVTGTPTLVTAPGEPMYTWVSAPSSITGIPTVVGWRHEAGYRGTAAYQARVQHVRSIYEADWPAAALLLDYHDVDYVYVGPVERDRYHVRRFAGHPGVTLAHRSGSVTIYRIDADAACGATNPTCPTD